MATVRYTCDDGIYYCEICSKKLHHPPTLYYCTRGHFFCANCFREEFSKSKLQTCLRKNCKSHVYRMDKQYELEKPLQKKSERRMFADFKSANAKTVPSSSSLARNHVLTIQESITTLSKKPVNCPYPGCRKTIAVDLVNQHFRYEHKLTASVTTRYNTRNEVKINPAYLETNQSSCIMLINILDSPTNEKSSIKPIFLVMASNIMNIHLQLQDDLDDEDCSEDTDSYNYYHYDKAIFWIASNITTKSKYTLALSTMCKTIRVKYYGSLSQINESCLKLSEEGKGLILHQMQILKMTNEGSKPLSLDFIIHKEETNDV